MAINNIFNLLCVLCSNIVTQQCSSKIRREISYLVKRGKGARALNGAYKNKNKREKNPNKCRFSKLVIYDENWA